MTLVRGDPNYKFVFSTKSNEYNSCRSIVYVILIGDNLEFQLVFSRSNDGNDSCGTIVQISSKRAIDLEFQLVLVRKNDGHDICRTIAYIMTLVRGDPNYKFVFSTKSNEYNSYRSIVYVSLIGDNLEFQLVFSRSNDGNDSGTVVQISSIRADLEFQLVLVRKNDAYDICETICKNVRDSIKNNDYSDMVGMIYGYYSIRNHDHIVSCKKIKDSLTSIGSRDMVSMFCGYYKDYSNYDQMLLNNWIKGYYDEHSSISMQRELAWINRINFINYSTRKDDKVARNNLRKDDSIYKSKITCDEVERNNWINDNCIKDSTRKQGRVVCREWFHDGIKFQDWYKEIFKWILFTCMFLLVSSAQAQNMKGLEIKEVNLMTHPIEFGQTAQIRCTITEKPKYTAWYKMPPHKLLSHMKSSSEASKYVLYLEPEAANFTTNFMYILKINNFSLSDVNFQYRCDADFQVKDITLQLNTEDYVAVPKEMKVKNGFEIKNQNLTGSLVIEHVYPRPMCAAFFEEKNITHDLSVVTLNNSMLFTLQIELRTSAKRCDGEIKINCTVGNAGHFVDYHRLVNNCPIAKKDELSLDWPILVLITMGVLFMLCFICFVVWCFFLRKKSIFRRCPEHYQKAATFDPKKIDI